VLGVEELRPDLRQRTLDNLREVCRERTTLPESCTVPHEVIELTTKPCAVSENAEIWTGSGEGSDSTMDLCVKVMKPGRVYKVGGPSYQPPAI
jgi:hypothetical protein